jgi:hypothetical protein
MLNYIIPGKTHLATVFINKPIEIAKCNIIPKKNYGKYDKSGSKIISLMTFSNMRTTCQDWQ